MKRIVVLLSVVVLMVVMLAMSVAPAFARPFHYFRCTNGAEVTFQTTQDATFYRNTLGYECRLDRG